MSLKEDLLALAALDRKVVRAVVEQDWRALELDFNDYSSLKKTVKSQLVGKPVASIDDPEAAAVLRKIIGGVGLSADKIFRQLTSGAEEASIEEDYDDSEISELGSELFYSWFSHYEYVSGLAELRPLVVRESVPENISQLVRQIKDCYAFQQYDAAYALCRTVIESCIRDICIRRKLFPQLGVNVVLFEEFRWSELRDKVSSGRTRERLRTLYSDLCAVIHGRRTADKDQARRAFAETLEIIEELYAAHDL